MTERSHHLGPISDCQLCAEHHAHARLAQSEWEEAQANFPLGSVEYVKAMHDHSRVIRAYVACRRAHDMTLS